MALLLPSTGPLVVFLILQLQVFFVCVILSVRHRNADESEVTVRVPSQNPKRYRTRYQRDVAYEVANPAKKIRSG